ncbi:threonine aldolase family protein [Enterococcus sp. LJL90]
MTFTLSESYQQTAYKIRGSGERTVGLLKEALAKIPDDTPSDIYGTGTVIEDFQTKMAQVLGKPAAVFFPSGTMAQQIGLRYWCDQKQIKKVAYHPLAHLEIHEQDGIKELMGIETILLGEKDRLFTLADLKALNQEFACLLIELPQREIGGQLPSFSQLKEITDYCHEKGIYVHLDGARLWECLPYYQKTAAEICDLFDSVYVSFYKGLNGIAGAILAGPTELTEASKIWKRRYGGDLISLYPYILSADYFYEKHIQRMPHYYQQAKHLAEKFNATAKISTLPQLPVTNMFHLHFAKNSDETAAFLAKLQNETGIGITGNLTVISESECACEISIGEALDLIPAATLAEMFKLLQDFPGDQTNAKI